MAFNQASITAAIVEVPSSNALGSFVSALQVSISGPSGSSSPYWELILSVNGTSNTSRAGYGWGASKSFLMDYSVPLFPGPNGVPTPCLSLPCTMTVNYYDPTTSTLLATASQAI